jgi:thioredoxin-like negative regulator of GroEL
MAPAVMMLVATSATCSARGEDAKPQAAEQQPESVSAATPATPPVVRLRHGIFKFTSYPAAWTSAQSTNRPILVFATSTNCPHCTRMVGETYRATQVSRFLNDSFETVYVSRAEQPDLTAKLKIRLFPTTIVVGPNNQVLDVIEGYVDSKTFAQRLQTTMAAHAAATQTR